jgi:hypothetical protein
MAAAGLTYLGIGRNNLALLRPEQRARPERLAPVRPDAHDLVEHEQPVAVLAELAAHAAARKLQADPSSSGDSAGPTTG